MKKTYNYDALLVLGAVMKWNPHMNKWDFPHIVDSYVGKLVMGKVRAFAASLLHNLAPIVLVTGGSDVHPETQKRVSRSVELAKLMNTKYEIPKEKIIPIGTAKASHTLGNAKNLIKYIDENPEILQNQKIAILSPRFQAKRAEIMFDMNPYFKENKIELIWLIAEDEIEKKHLLFPFFSLNIGIRVLVFDICMIQ